MTTIKTADLKIERTSLPPKSLVVYNSRGFPALVPEWLENEPESLMAFDGTPDDWLLCVAESSVSARGVLISAHIRAGASK